ncbi:hypothetical protein C0995_009891 [Termitomyces sp. Mi166|nr:hypothetical protein C0995_009891 [Termitomyces sp. Mi166\
MTSIGAESHDIDAERVSNLIDETLKASLLRPSIEDRAHTQEALRKKEARAREVRVLLLGQSESGKSTLQKQFQLFYASHTLEREKPSWRPAIYLNIIRAARTLLEGLEYEVAMSTDNPPDPDFPITKGISDEVAAMAALLQPLLEAEPPLTLELNGGFTGRASAYARFGWQALITPRRSTSDALTDLTPSGLRVAEMLKTYCQAVERLWRYPLVISLLARRKTRIEESAP